MTLVELLAGLVILGTVLSAMVVARGRLLRQWGQADRKILAGKELDAMFADWTEFPTFSPPIPGQGQLAGASHFIWRSQWVPNPAAVKLNSAVARVEVFESMNARGPILTVDLLLHREPPRRQPAVTTRPGGAP